MNLLIRFFWQLFCKPSDAQVEDIPPIVLQVPREHERRIRELADAYMAAPTGRDRVAQYDLWAAVEELFPVVAKGQWRIAFDSIGVRIIERVD